jgi:hypothetical protein
MQLQRTAFADDAVAARAGCIFMISMHICHLIEEASAKPHEAAMETESPRSAQFALRVARTARAVDRRPNRSHGRARPATEI